MSMHLNYPIISCIFCTLLKNTYFNYLSTTISHEVGSMRSLLLENINMQNSLNYFGAKYVTV
jgi:hypothetical protein